MRKLFISALLAAPVVAHALADDPECNSKNVTKQCYASAAQSELLLLGLATSIELSKMELEQQTYGGMFHLIGAQRSAAISRVEALYKALGKRSPKAAAPARKFFIEWRAAMDGTTPNSSDTKRTLAMRQEKLSADVNKAAIDLTTD